VWTRLNAIKRSRENPKQAGWSAAVVGHVTHAWHGVPLAPMTL